MDSEAGGMDATAAVATDTAPGAAAVEWSDKRSALRQRTLKSGRAVVNGVEVARVTVRNMSLTGARLVSPDCEGLPDAFTLSVGDEGLSRQVEVRSRSATGMGVRFLKPLSTREFGAEFLQASSGRSRERDVASQRADLVRRATEGLAAMDLGFTPPPLVPVEAPALEMPDAPDERAGDVTGDPIGREAEDPDDPVGGEPDILNEPGTREAGTREPVVMEPAIRDAAPVDGGPVDGRLTDGGPDDGLDDGLADDGLGEGALARVAPSHPPRAVRLRLPWAATA